MNKPDLYETCPDCGGAGVDLGDDWVGAMHTDCSHCGQMYYTADGESVPSCDTCGGSGFAPVDPAKIIALSAEGAKRVEALFFGMWQVLMERNPDHERIIAEMKVELRQLLRGPQ